MGGQYLLRIEDTDRARSTPEAIEAILDGLNWLDLQHDGEITYQFARAAQHREAAEEMIGDSPGPSGGPALTRGPGSVS